jgi:hypothetical protein
MTLIDKNKQIAFNIHHTNEDIFHLLNIKDKAKPTMNVTIW